jgi:hypothetical protein
MNTIVTVIVEEAAEVMESHVIACLNNYCQHLILIGKLFICLKIGSFMTYCIKGCYIF